MEERLDKILLQRKLVSSRTRGEELITRGDVLVNGKSVNKPGKKFPVDVALELLSAELEWVSRGALKLIAALDEWKVPVAGLRWMDIGASTGGFTEVLLNRGADHITCIDVGHKQLHERLRSDSRIANFEKTHVRELSNHHFPEKVNGAVVDVSFISLEKVIPFLLPYFTEPATLVVLVKPQFEVGKGQLNKQGVVRQASLYEEIKSAMEQLSANCGLVFKAWIPSPILGGDGNKEFLMLLEKA